MDSCIVNTVIEWCNDVRTMRGFYTELLGMNETFFDENRGWLTYESAGLQVVFISGSEKLPVTTEFAKNPAYEGGTIEAQSWVMQVSPDDFDEVVRRLKDADVRAYAEEPSVHGGWRHFYVLDPMGRTIELSCPPPADEIEVAS